MFWSYPTHSGIVPEIGRIWTYNNGNTNVYEIPSVQKNEINKVISMFDEIKRKINGKLGCACICLNNQYKNEIKESFIEAGKNCGFEKVEIIDYQTANFFKSISEANYIPQKGEVFWIVEKHFLKIYKKVADKLNYYGICSLRCTTKEKIKDLMRKSGMDETPIVILFEVNSSWSVANIRDMFPRCRIIRLRQNVYYVRGTLVKARIMADDTDVTKYGIKEINAIPSPPRVIFTITDTDVFVDDPKSIERISFSSSIDYGLNIPKVGVNYCSPTVIRRAYQNLKPCLIIILDDMKNFGTIPLNNSPIPIREILDGNIVKQYYIIKFGNIERQIAPKTVIIDLFKEVKRRIDIDKKVLILTIPSHFSENQKEMFLNTAKMAGLTNVISVEEQLSLAFGYEMLFNVSDGADYVIISFYNQIFEIILYKAGIFGKTFSTLKTFKNEKFKDAKNFFFDDIILTAKYPKRKPRTKFDENSVEEMLQRLFTEVQKFSDTVENLHSIVVSCEQFYYSLLCLHFPELNIIFVEDPIPLIIDGANFA